MLFKRNTYLGAKPMKQYSDVALAMIPGAMRYRGEEYENYICPVCQDICRKPRQCKDGHLFCFECLKQVIEHNPSCPVCRTDLALETISRNLVAEKQIENLLVWCRYHFELGEDEECLVSEDGCTESLMSSNLAAHEKQCLYAWTICPYGSDKCGKVRKMNRSEHEVECTYRTTACEYCYCLVQLSSINEHQLECKAGPVQCSHCNEELTRGNLSTHEKENCLESFVQCPYKCAELVKRKDLKEHNKEYIAQHLDCIREDMHEKHDSELKQRDEHIQELNGKIDILNKKIQALSEGATIQWKLKWKTIEDESYAQESFCFEDVNLTIWLYPDGDTHESKGFLSLFIFYEHEDLPEKEFSFFQKIDQQVTKQEYIKKLKYYFEVINFRDNLQSTRSGDIIFSLYPNRGASLMKGERKMIERDLISKESGFLNEEGELCIILHMDHSKTMISL
jgi:hypothetical protein